jgi:plasmid maintenance system antidote protein VapI
MLKEPGEPKEENEGEIREEDFLREIEASLDKLAGDLKIPRERLSKIIQKRFGNPSDTGRER